MTSPFDLALSYLDTRHLAFVNDFSPHCLISIGAHLAQLENYRRWMKNKAALFTARGAPRNVRVHIHFAAPSGFLKSALWELFLNEDYGLASGPIQTAIETSTTEAGWVGTYVTDNPEDEANYGMAYHLRNGIVGFDEFSSIMANMMQEHSATLETQLLKSLESGNIRKKLGRIWIRYHTDVSLWAATQPARWDLRAGFARRFDFLNWNPNEKQVEEVYNAYLKGLNIPPDMSTVWNFRKGLEAIQKKLSTVEKVTYDFDLRKEIPEIKFHWMQELAERMLIGLTVIRDDFDTTLHIRADDLATRILKQSWEWRKSVVMTAEGSQILAFLPCTRKQLYIFMWGLGYTSDKVDALIGEMIKKRHMKAIKIEGIDGYDRLD